MRKFFLVLIMLSVFILSSCGLSGYERVDYTYEGQKMFYQKPQPARTSCDAFIEGYALFATDGDKSYYVTDSIEGYCTTTFYIKINERYLNLSQAIEEEYLVIEDIESIDWDFEIYEGFTQTVIGNVTKIEYKASKKILERSFSFPSPVHQLELTDQNEINETMNALETGLFLKGYAPVGLDTGTLLVYIDDIIYEFILYGPGIYDVRNDAFCLYLNLPNHQTAEAK